MKKWLLISVVVGLPLTGMAATPHEAVSVSPLEPFGAFPMVDGAVVLTRDFRNKLLTANLSVTNLPYNEAFSIWWVVFNRPANCSTPNVCGGPDLGNTAVKGSAFWAGGFVTDDSGTVNLTLQVGPGQTQREVFAGSDVGLQDLRAAEVHLVVRGHGTTGVAGPVAAQIGTANEACPGGFGTCENQYFAVHRN